MTPSPAIVTPALTVHSGRRLHGNERTAPAVDGGRVSWNRGVVRVVMLRLLRDVPCPPEEAGAIVAALRACAEPADGLEHAYAQVGVYGADVVLFMAERVDGEAEAVARSLVDRALARDLDRYHLLFAHTDVRLSAPDASSRDQR
jgi:hypothetical protein